jgi:hypothetical protein
VKLTGKRSAGNPHAAFDKAGAGNVTMGAGLRPMAKAMDEPPDPNVRAPVLDPTCERDNAAESYCGATLLDCSEFLKGEAGRALRHMVLSGGLAGIPS